MHNFTVNKTTTDYDQLSNGNDCNRNEAANNNMEVIFLGKSTCDSQSSSIIKDPPTSSRFANNRFNSCKTLQRKLELKVERAKKNFNQNAGCETIKEVKSNNACLIPIDRLPIPGHKENVTLVEYKSEESNSDDNDDDDDEVSSPFFPMKSRLAKKLDLSDTFSIQEMTIESDSGDESGDSQNLELLPPSVRIKFIDKIINYLCCTSPEPLS